MWTIFKSIEFVTIFLLFLFLSFFFLIQIIYFKYFIEFVTIPFLFMFCFFVCEACGILAPKPGIKPSPLQWKVNS